MYPLNQLEESCFTLATNIGDLYILKPALIQSCKNIVSSPQLYLLPPPNSSEKETLL